MNAQAQAPAPPANGGASARWRGIEQRLAALEARLDTILPTLATKADLGELRSEIQKGIVETQRWMIATIVGLFIGFGGLFLAMSTALRSGPAAPVVITLPAATQPGGPAPAASARP